MIYSVKILNEGDKVLNVWEDKIAILRVSGEVDIYKIILEDECLPRFSEDIWRITYGNGLIEISGDAAKKNNNIEEDDDDFVISIKSPKGKK